MVRVFVNHHTRSIFNSQFLRKPQKRWLFSLTPQVWDHAYKNIKRRCRFTWYSWFFISVINTTVFFFFFFFFFFCFCFFFANVDQFRPDLGPLHFFLDQFRTGSRPTTLWYLFSISLICRPLRRFLKWRVQIFSYSVKGVQMLRKYRFGGKNLRYSLGSKSAWMYMAESCLNLIIALGILKILN